MISLAWRHPFLLQCWPDTFYEFIVLKLFYYLLCLILIESALSLYPGLEDYKSNKTNKWVLLEGTFGGNHLIPAFMCLGNISHYPLPYTMSTSFSLTTSSVSPLSCCLAVFPLSNHSIFLFFPPFLYCGITFLHSCLSSLFPTSIHLKFWNEMQQLGLTRKQWRSLVTFYTVVYSCLGQVKVSSDISWGNLARFQHFKLFVILFYTPIII